jgi:hypothetical protein
MKKNIVLVAALFAATAGAQQVYRCGNSYGTQPCAGAAQVSVADPSSERDAARARAAAKADAQRADAMEKTRLAQEKQAPKAVVPPQAVASAPVAKMSAAKGKGDKGKKPEHFTAVAPGPAKKAK